MCTVVLVLVTETRDTEERDYSRVRDSRVLSVCLACLRLFVLLL
jgi:hypothetical protein